MWQRAQITPAITGFRVLGSETKLVVVVQPMPSQVPMCMQTGSMTRALSEVANADHGDKFRICYLSHAISKEPGWAKGLYITPVIHSVRKA
jgi:hypothetical protein